MDQILDAEIVSPVIKKGSAKTMTFDQAIAEVIKGKKITRLEWSSNDEYGYRRNELLLIHTKGQDHQWLLSDGDMLANDWVVLPEVN